MKTIALAWRYLWARPLAAVLNLTLLSLGLASVTLVVLAQAQLEQGLRRDLAGIDAVVGAKGSPIQLILAGVFHLDTPTGNVKLGEVQALVRDPRVAHWIPLSLGDSFRGFRIVGTTPDYLAHYDARMARGRVWADSMDAVLGAQVAAATGLTPGQTFEGSHGLSQAGDTHSGHPYRVSGVLAACACVLDRLILTATESVWALHAAAHADANDSHPAAHADARKPHPAAHADANHPHPAAQADAKNPNPAAQAEDKHRHPAAHADANDSHPAAQARAKDPHPAAQAERELTVVLIRYSSPLAAVSFPRFVNDSTRMQAAAPAVEVARLMRMVGVGADLLRGLGLLLLFTGALSVLMALWSAVRERRQDLALLRMLGAPPARLAALLLCEALWLAGLASLLGLLAGHGLTALLGLLLDTGQALPLSAWAWVDEELGVPALALAVAALAALLPAWSAYRTEAGLLLNSR